MTSVDEYDRGLIKKHEHTRPKKVDDRATHIMTLKAQVGPVLSIFRHNDEIKNLLQNLTAKNPEIDFTSDDTVRHELWVISDDNNINTLTKAFAKLGELYIADGHHRSQSASEVCRRMKEQNPNHTGKEIYNYFLNVIFPDNELRILPYNRIIKDLNNMPLDEFIAKTSNNFDIVLYDQPVAPTENHKIGMYSDKKWYVMTIKKGTFNQSNPAESIDSAILTKNLLDPILGIKDVRTDERIDFVGGIRGVKELTKLVDSSEYKIAFSMYPVSVEQLLQVADAGEVMPPKSTWFEPKLRSGMVVNLLKD